MPGFSYVIAISGRELLRGVIRALAERAPELSQAEQAAIRDSEKHRGPIARALQLHPRHPLVDVWHDLQARFSGEGKYVEQRSTPSGAISDFRTLTSLLVGRLAPYFTAQDAADRLLAVEQPGEEHFEPLQEVLVRPALRRYFFNALTDPKWLPLLMRVRAFMNPPRRRVNEDQSWSVAPWPEGEYLVRIASAEPDAVAAVLAKIPPDNDNPGVWDVAGRAAVALPPALAAQLVPHILEGVKAQPHVLFPRTLLDLAKHVADEDVESALAIADTLLWIRHRDDVVTEQAENADTTTSLRLSTSWLLARIDQYEATEVLDTLTKELSERDPKAVLQLLGRKLHAALRSMDPSYQEEAPRHTYYWCRDCAEVSENDDDLRAVIAGSIVHIAAEVARANEAGAQWVLSYLGTLARGIGERLKYAVLARCGPYLSAEVDQLLRRSDVLEFDAPGREIGDVLRARFSEADEEAQRQFFRTLESGPSADELAHLVEWERETAGIGSEAKAREKWQRRQLRRFGRNVPVVLQPMAQAISYEPADPSSEELDLVEIGWSFGGVSWVGSESPIDDDSLRGDNTAEVARRIEAWSPSSPADEANLRGLDDAIQRLSNDSPERVLELAIELLSLGTFRGLGGVFRGLREAVKSGKEIDWQRMATVVGGVLRHRAAQDRDEWRGVASAVVDFFDDAGVEHAPLELIEETFGAGAALLEQESTWIDDGSTREFASLDGIITASINSLPGRILALLVRLALRQTPERTTGVAEQEADKVSTEIGDTIHEAIEGVLSRSGRRATAARATIGTYLPQLRWLSPSWWERHEESVLASGISNPYENPIWATYLARATLYNDTFIAFRPLYAFAARTWPRSLPEGAHRTWEPEPHLVEHILIAYLRGLARLGEHDELVEQTFNRAVPEDASHAYWGIFRGWTDASESGDGPPDGFVERLVEFWKWRLDQLEQSQDQSHAAAEADGLLWFGRTPFIPLHDVMDLGRRTLALVQSAGGTLHLFSERFPEIAEADPDVAFVMLERAIRIELSSRWPHFPMKDLDVVFARIFAAGSTQTRASALRLLDLLGDEGYPDFGSFRPPS